MKRAGLLVLLAASPASADRRTFAWTYEYPTLLAGQTSLELTHTHARPVGEGDIDRLEQSFEIEHGLTDRWDAGLAGVFSQQDADPPVASQPFSFHALRLETRYQFGERHDAPLDIAAYARGTMYFGSEVYAAEARVIVARDVDALTIAANVAGIITFGDDVFATQYHVGWSAGATYELHPKLDLGVETYGARWLNGERTTSALVGPVIALAPAPSFWLTVTAGFGVTSVAPDVEARLLVGIEL